MGLIGSLDTGLGSVPTAGDVSGSGGGGGAWPGFGGVPPAIAPAGSAGISAFASRSDHTHAQSFNSILGIGPTALGTVGVGSLPAHSDQTHSAYRSDLPLSTTWFVDPVNGNNTFAGTTNATAVKDRDEVYRRWWIARISANTTITILGNIAANTLNPLVTIDPGVTVTIIGSLGATTGGGGVAINNTLYTGSVTNFVAASPTPAADDIELVDAAVTTGTFTGAGLMVPGVICRRTVPTTVHWWLLKDINATIAHGARITAPMNNVAVRMDATLVIGQAFSAFQTWRVPVDYWGSYANQVIYDSIYDNSATGQSGQQGWAVQRRRNWIGGTKAVITGGIGWTNCLVCPEANRYVVNGVGVTPPLMNGGGFKGDGTGTSQCTFEGRGGFFGAITSQDTNLGVADGSHWSVNDALAVHDNALGFACVSAQTGGLFSFNTDTHTIAGTGLSGKGNAGYLLQANIGGMIYYGNTSAAPPCIAASTTLANPISIGANQYTVAQLPATVDTILTPGTVFPGNPTLPVPNGVQAVVIGATGPAAIVTPGAPAGWETFYDAAGVKSYRPYWQ